MLSYVRFGDHSLLKLIGKWAFRGCHVREINDKLVIPDDGGKCLREAITNPEPDLNYALITPGITLPKRLLPDNNLQYTQNMYL